MKWVLAVLVGYLIGLVLDYAEAAFLNEYGDDEAFGGTV